MSSNDAIRLTEQEDSRWEVLRYNVDMDVEQYRNHGPGCGKSLCFRCKLPIYSLPRYVASLDAALDMVKSTPSEYGLEIVRLKDTQTSKHLHECDCGWAEPSTPNWEELLDGVPGTP